MLLTEKIEKNELEEGNIEKDKLEKLYSLNHEVEENNSEKDEDGWNSEMEKCMRGIGKKTKWKMNILRITKMMVILRRRTKMSEIVVRLKYRREMVLTNRRKEIWR